MYGFCCQHETEPRNLSLRSWCMERKYHVIGIWPWQKWEFKIQALRSNGILITYRWRSRGENRWRIEMFKGLDIWIFFQCHSWYIKRNMGWNFQYNEYIQPSKACSISVTSIYLRTVWKCIRICFVSNLTTEICLNCFQKNYNDQSNCDQLKNTCNLLMYWSI